MRKTEKLATPIRSIADAPEPLNSWSLLSPTYYDTQEIGAREKKNHRVSKEI